MFSVNITSAMGIEERFKRSMQAIDRAIVSPGTSINGTYHAAIPASAMDGALKVRLDQEYRRTGFDVEFAEEEIDGAPHIVVSLRLPGSSI